MILGIQIIGVVFGLWMAYFSFLYYKRKEFNFLQFLFWEVLWLVFIIVIILPDSVNIITERLGIIRAMDLFVIAGFILIISLTFHNYVTVSKLRKKLENSVRNKALKKLDKE